jgi:23S rRNA pseudouridine1911/1915/1917 synthase
LPASKIKIVYEDNNILIIDKPSGLLTHPMNRKDESESVVSWLLKEHPEIGDVQDEYGASVGQWVDLRPGIVHRLDRETSGLMVIAKTQTAFEYLKKLFQERKIKKTYLALVHGRLKSKNGKIEMPLGKLGTRQTARIRGKHELKEKTAVTEYRVMQEYSQPLLTNLSYDRFVNSYSLLEIMPKTGRTHQIRVHLKSIGHPVVCDPLYSGKKLVCPPKLGRLFLHAQKLSFVSPSGKALTVETDLPPELAGFLESLQKTEN